MSSWWDTSGFTNLASQALKNAQKKIDKVLDIEEEDRAKRRRAAASQKKAAEKESTPEKTGNEQSGGDFWSAWMSPSSESVSENKESSPAPSSWSLPWSSPVGNTSPDQQKKASAKSRARTKLDISDDTGKARAEKTGQLSDLETLEEKISGLAQEIIVEKEEESSVGVVSASDPAEKRSTMVEKTEDFKNEGSGASIEPDILSQEENEPPAADDNLEDQKGVSETDGDEASAPYDLTGKSVDTLSAVTMAKEENSNISEPSEEGEIMQQESQADGAKAVVSLADDSQSQQTEGNATDGWQDFSIDGWADSVDGSLSIADLISDSNTSIETDGADNTTKSEELVQDLSDKEVPKCGIHLGQGDGDGLATISDIVKANDEINASEDSSRPEELGSEFVETKNFEIGPSVETESEIVSQDEEVSGLTEQSFRPEGEDLISQGEREEKMEEIEVGNEVVEVSMEKKAEENISETELSSLPDNEDKNIEQSVSELSSDVVNEDHEMVEEGNSTSCVDVSEDSSVPVEPPVPTEVCETVDTSEMKQSTDFSEEFELKESSESVVESETTDSNLVPDFTDRSEPPKEELEQTAPSLSGDMLLPQAESSELRDSSSSSFTDLVEDNVSETSGDARLDAPDTDHKPTPVGPEEVHPQSDHAVEPLSTELSQEYVNISASCPEEPQNTSLDSSGATLTDLGSSRTNSDLDLLGGQTSSTGSSDTSRFDSSMDTVIDKSTVDEMEPQTFSLFGEQEKDAPEHLITSMDSSYVESMLEEAMKESKTEDSGSDHHSSGDKSESSKPDSEHDKSVYSGHESSDDIETTTSSDIEIIQAPGANGEDKFHKGFDLSPLKIALQKTAGGQGHHRSDSQSSSSAHSKEHLSPERGEASHWRDEDEGHHDLKAVREEDRNNPYHPERLLKKLAEMAEVLQARETKLVELSKENHQLMEDKNILYTQLQQLEVAHAAETADLNALTDEFTARLGEAEKKIQTLLKEKETLKQRLTSTEKELQRRSGDSDLEALLEEKKEQVQELLAEGEKLSKQQLQSSNIIKKLRAKEKESEATITSHKKKLDEQSKELDRLTTILDAKEDLEKKQAEAINQLNTAVQLQEKELTKLRSDLEDVQEKNRGLQSALESSYKEIAELHRSNASQDSKAQEAALSAETQVREELKAAMEREQQRFKQEREAFIIQADDLRMDMTRLEKEHSRREDILRQEIAHLQQRLQEDESRSQELTQSVTSATRPLLRQIENLQATYGAQSTAWERVEKNLTDRLAEAQTNLAVAQEKERAASEKTMELTARVTTLETASSRLKQEKAQLSAQLESERAKLEELQDGRQSLIAQLETAKHKLSEELNQLTVDKIHLESQLNVEKTKLDNEKKKALALEEQLRVIERERPKSRARSTPSPSPSMSVSRQESLAGSFYEGAQSPGWNWSSYHEDHDSVAGAKSNMYDSLRHSGAAIVVENLQSQLKLKEGEIVQLQSEISQLERTRESMARELVDLTYKNEELEENKQAHEQLRKTYEELNGRYSALLQMYGEKEEQVQELRLDLQDVKEMYKSQIDALMAQ